ncbi:MAG: GNAT family N-acetyltransferase [Planctomycetes bacterium]|nr:GNAT family N-acetyltransferase [Planctomycetota bacterium]
MHDIDSFRTERLLANRITFDDFDDLCRMYQDPAVMATLAGVRTPEATRQYLQSNLNHWEQHGYGLWSMRDPADGRFLGRGGLRNLQVDGVTEVEVSYAVCAEFWRKGFATEMARAYVQVAFEKLDLDNVVCFTLPTNAGSRRVIEKVGFLYERDFIHADLPHVFYRLRRKGSG